MMDALLDNHGSIELGVLQAYSPKKHTLSVSATGIVTSEVLAAYQSRRQNEIARRLAKMQEIESVNAWFDELSADVLFEMTGGEQTFRGNQSSKDEAVNTARRENVVNSVLRAKEASTLVDRVAAIEDLIHFFCGFDSVNAVCLVNAVHFQFEVDMTKLLSTKLPALSASEPTNDTERDLFDGSAVASAELLLRSIVKTSNGTLVASPFSPGLPMSFLLKLPMYAQLVMVLTNAVEATWYQEDIPDCPMAINLYASLLVDGAPILDMVHGVRVVEVMEMSKGAKRGPEVKRWVRRLREHNIEVLLDDFDTNHPAAESDPDGIKVCVFANAFHSLQALKEDGALNADGSPLDMAFVDKEHVNNMDFKDFHCSIVPKMQPHIKKLVMEGSENCLKSEMKGPPLNFDHPQATLATAHVYQAAARALRSREPNARMFQQGGRALYENEVFDEATNEIIQSLGMQMVAARKGHAGTLAWVGDEAQRRATLKVRPLVCGVVKQLHCAGLAPMPAPVVY